MITRELKKHIVWPLKVISFFSLDIHVDWLNFFICYLSIQCCCLVLVNKCYITHRKRCHNSDLVTECDSLVTMFEDVAYCQRNVLLLQKISLHFLWSTHWNSGSEFELRENSNTTDTIIYKLLFLVQWPSVIYIKNAFFSS